MELRSNICVKFLQLVLSCSTSLSLKHGHHCFCYRLVQIVDFLAELNRSGVQMNQLEYEYFSSKKKKLRLSILMKGSLVPSSQAYVVWDMTTVQIFPSTSDTGLLASVLWNYRTHQGECTKRSPQKCDDSIACLQYTGLLWCTPTNDWRCIVRNVFRHLNGRLSSREFCPLWAIKLHYSGQMWYEKIIHSFE